MVYTININKTKIMKIGDIVFIKSSLDSSGNYQSGVVSKQIGDHTFNVFIKGRETIYGEEELLESCGCEYCGKTFPAINAVSRQHGQHKLTYCSEQCLEWSLRSDY